jgi:hypothetical protein
MTVTIGFIELDYIGRGMAANLAVYSFDVRAFHLSATIRAMLGSRLKVSLVTMRGPR